MVRKPNLNVLYYLLLNEPALVLDLNNRLQLPIDLLLNSFLTSKKLIKHETKLEYYKSMIGRRRYLAHQSKPNELPHQLSSEHAHRIED